MSLDSGKNRSDTPDSLALSRADLYCVLAIVAYCMVVFTPKIGAYGFWDPWEPKYSQSVREMFQRGEIVTPYYNGKIRYSKPILVYWAIMASAKFLGLSEFSARLSGTLAATIGCLALYLALSRIRNRRAGLMGAAVLATMPQYFFLARMATTDIYLTSSSGAAAAFFILAFSRKAMMKHALIGGYAFVALAVLAKGPIGLIVPALAVGLIVLWQWDPGVVWSPELFRRVARFVPASAAALAASAAFGCVTLLAGAPTWWWYNDLPAGLQRIRNAVLSVTGSVPVPEKDDVRMPGFQIAIGIALCAACFALFCLILARFAQHDSLKTLRSQTLAFVKQVMVFSMVFCLIAGTWYGAVLFKHGGFWVEEFIGKHNIHRATVEVNDHGGKADFYLRALFFATFPWIALVPVSVGLCGRSRAKGEALAGSPGLLCLVWLAVLYSFYTYPNTKFYHYIAPALPVAALLIGLGLDRLLSTTSRDEAKAWIAVGAGLFAVCLVHLMRWDYRFIVNMFTVKLAVPGGVLDEGYVRWFYLLWGLSLLLLLISAARGRLRKASIVALMASAFMFAHYCTSDFMPALAVHKTLKPLVVQYDELKRPGEKIALFGKTKHGMIFYTDRQVVMLGRNTPSLIEFMKGPSRAFCVVQRSDMNRVTSAMKKAGLTMHILQKRHFDYSLVSNRG